MGGRTSLVLLLVLVFDVPQLLVVGLSSEDTQGDFDRDIGAPHRIQKRQTFKFGKRGDSDDWTWHPLGNYADDSALYKRAASDADDYAGESSPKRSLETEGEEDSAVEKRPFGANVYRNPNGEAKNQLDLADHKRAKFMFGKRKFMFGKRPYGGKMPIGSLHQRLNRGREEKLKVVQALEDAGIGLIPPLERRKFLFGKRYYSGDADQDGSDMDEEKRKTFLLGKRYEDEDLEKRKFLLGKRYGDENPEKRKFLLGKRYEDVGPEKRKFLLGKRYGDESPEKRKFLLGKRYEEEGPEKRKFLLGKRYEDESPEKRKFLLGKRPSGSDTNNTESDHTDGKRPFFKDMTKGKRPFGAKSFKFGKRQ